MPEASARRRTREALRRRVLVSLSILTLAFVFAYLSALTLHTTHHHFEPGHVYTSCAVAFGAQHTPHHPVELVLLDPLDNAGPAERATESTHRASTTPSPTAFRGPPLG